MPLAEAVQELLKLHQLKHLVMSLRISTPKLTPHLDFEGPERRSTRLIISMAHAQDNPWKTRPENSQTGYDIEAIYCILYAVKGIFLENNALEVIHITSFHHKKPVVPI